MIARKNGAVCAASVLRRTTIGAMAALAVLAGAPEGGHDGQQRGVNGLQTRDDVVIELVTNRLGRGTSRLDLWQVKGETHLVQIGAQPAQLGQQFLGTHRHNLHENQRGDPCTQDYRVCPDSPPLILLARNGAKRRSVPVPAPAHMTSRRITVFDEASLHLVLRTHGLAP